MIIAGKPYKTLNIMDELESKWKDGRPYIQEFYELKDEADDKFFLTVWSDDRYELGDEPIMAVPLATGDIKEIRGI